MSTEDNITLDVPNTLESQACESTLSRKQFISKIVGRGVAAGAILAGCQMTDKFLLPPAYAQASGGSSCVDGVNCFFPQSCTNGTADCG